MASLQLLRVYFGGVNDIMTSVSIPVRILLVFLSFSVCSSSASPHAQAPPSPHLPTPACLHDLDSSAVLVYFFFLYLKNIHVHVKSRYYNQASGPSFGSSSPSERAQGWRESPCRMAPPANLLPVLYPVCEHSAATGLPGKKPLIG